MRVLGIGASVSGHLVVLNPNGSSPLYLDVQSDCTGLQGILAFGMLSIMALLDLKPKISKLIPLLVVGFAGAFLINILRLIVVFLTFEFLGADAGTTMHVYFGYVIFIAWVMVFWTLAFRYLAPRSAAVPSPTPISLPPRPRNDALLRQRNGDHRLGRSGIHFSDPFGGEPPLDPLLCEPESI